MSAFTDLGRLADRVLANEPRAVARAIRAVDDRAPGYLGLLKGLWPHTGKAWVVGVTGNPGAGKSTLSDRLIEAYRKRGARVAVVAVDPTSPYTGGAILGDRVRMTRHATDEGVFIRSLATRGHLGGLSASARDVVRVLDACGYGVVLVETVGVGQDELEVTGTAATTLVVMAPGMGDEVQAIKAGILECADVFAVNKADREGADATVRDLELMIALGTESLRALSGKRGHATHTAADAHVRSEGGQGEGRQVSGSAGAWSNPGRQVSGSAGAWSNPGRQVSGSAGAWSNPGVERWTPPIVKCIATRGEGIEGLVAALDAHRAWIETSEAGKARRRARLSEELRQALREALIEAAVGDLGARIEDAVTKVEGRAADPYTMTEELVRAFRDSCG